MAAHGGTAAPRWTPTIGRQRRLRMRYSMPSPSSATQGRCNSVQLQGWTRARRWWRDGPVRWPAQGGHGRAVCYELNVLGLLHTSLKVPDSRCGTRAMRAGGYRDCCSPCMARMAAAAEISESFGPWRRLCCCQARGSPGQGLWRGEESVVCSG